MSRERGNVMDTNKICETKRAIRSYALADYLNQTDNTEILSEILTQHLSGQWLSTTSPTSKDMKLINRSEHLVELECLSY